jgi:UDP-glucuronate 4-epimerase
MKIALFGGKGFIGKALRERLGQGHTVVVFDQPEFDIRDEHTFAPALAHEKPDAVINLAAILGTMKESPSIESLFDTNVQANLKLATAARSAGVKVYVFASSMTVHGENQIDQHQTRLSVFNPKHGYSASKAAAEYSLMQFAKEAPDMKLIAVRPTMVLGKGTYLPHAPIEFVKTILSGKNIELYGEGRHEREWIWLDDVTYGMQRAAEFGVTAKPGYHPFFLSGNRISMRDLAEKVAAQLGGKVTITPSTSQAFTLTADSTDSYELLGWKPSIDIDAMIEKIIEFEKK